VAKGVGAVGGACCSQDGFFCSHALDHDISQISAVHISTDNLMVVLRTSPGEAG
jgi:hypothetical protein